MRSESRVLVLGGDGDGKSSLLQVLAGDLDASAGRYLWDDRDVTAEAWLVRDTVGFLPEEPLMRGTTVRDLLGLTGDEAPGTDDLEMLQVLGAWRGIRRFTEGLDQALDSRRLAWSEKRSICLASVVLSSHPVWILDRPVAATRGRDRKRLAHILDRAAGRTLIVSLQQPILTERFTHVVVLKKGRVEFSGSPDQWRATHG